MPEPACALSAASSNRGECQSRDALPGSRSGHARLRAQAALCPPMHAAPLHTRKLRLRPPLGNTQGPSGHKRKHTSCGPRPHASAAAPLVDAAAPLSARSATSAMPPSASSVSSRPRASPSAHTQGR